VAVGGSYETGNGVGDAASKGVILTSLDGKNWTLQNVNNLPYLSKVVWTRTEFVAAGMSAKKKNVVYTSPDGHNWTDAHASFEGTFGAGSTEFTDVIWAGSQLAALDFFDSVYTSPDGHHWTTRVETPSNDLSSLAWSGSQFVGVGIGGAIATSPDGITWTAQPTSSSESLNSVVWADKQFVAVGMAILTSPNGITWTPRPRSSCLTSSASSERARSL